MTLFCFTNPPGRSASLPSFSRTGPFRVVQRVHNELYVIEDLNTYAPQSVHVQRLARYFPYADTSSTDTSQPVQPEPDNAPPPPLQCDVGDYIIYSE